MEGVGILQVGIFQVPQPRGLHTELDMDAAYMCPKLEPYYTWKVGGGLKGVDISMLSLPRQQSKMRITWVSTGTPCKSKICLKILIKGYRMLEVYMFFRVFLSEYYHSFVTTYCCENNKTPVHKCPFNLNFKIYNKPCKWSA